MGIIHGSLVPIVEQAKELASDQQEHAKQTIDNKVSLDKVWAATFDWGAFFNSPAGKAIGVMAVTLLGLVISSINDKMKTVVPVAPPAVNIVVQPGDPISPISPSSPIGPSSVVTHKITLYTTDEKQAAFATDPMFKANLSRGYTVVVDAKIYVAGQVYNFNKKEIPVPCAALADGTGKVLDVQPFTTAVEILKMAKGNNP